MKVMTGVKHHHQSKSLKHFSIAHQHHYFAVKNIWQKKTATRRSVAVFVSQKANAYFCNKATIVRFAGGKSSAFKDTIGIQRDNCPSFP